MRLLPDDQDSGSVRKVGLEEYMRETWRMFVVGGGYERRPSEKQPNAIFCLGVQKRSWARQNLEYLS